MNQVFDLIISKIWFSRLKNEIELSNTRLMGKFTNHTKPIINGKTARGGLTEMVFERIL